MPAIASTDVTYTVQNSSFRNDMRAEHQLKIEFGDAALTYPAGGIPLDKALMGFPDEIFAFNLEDDSSADGYTYKYDKVNNKIRIYQANIDVGADAPDIELGAVAVAATDLYAVVSGS